jgi:hypothetical protein
MEIVKIEVTFADGSVQTINQAAPVAVTEVDVVEGDKTEKFIPETPAA